MELFLCTHLGVEHVLDPIYGPIQHQASDEEDEENHIREHRGEVHHLRRKAKEQDSCMTTGIWSYFNTMIEML